MDYTVKLYWNDTQVFDGKATFVTAYNIAHDFIEGNFAGPAHKIYCKDFSLNDVSTVGRSAFQWSDETGRAQAVIERIS